MVDPFLLLILSSPSGAGKTTLTRKLQERFPALRFSVSHTTRRPRSNESNGRMFHVEAGGGIDDERKNAALRRAFA